MGEERYLPCPICKGVEGCDHTFPERQRAKTERNARVQARYDALMAGGKHGHYETMFKIVQEEVEAITGTCKAQPTADPPQDCDWPFCGCDPHADKVLAAIEESGLIIGPDPMLQFAQTQRLMAP